MRQKNIFPKNISNIKRNAILEALQEWKIKKPNNYNESLNFIKHMEELGWKDIGYGAFKRCLVKNSIVIKFAMDPEGFSCIREIDREYEQYISSPKELKKYLPKTYTLYNGLMIQDKVLENKCYSNCEDTISTLRNKFNLFDCYHNHGHNRIGKIKFFDWVWKRDGAYLTEDIKTIRLKDNDDDFKKRG